MCFVAGAPSSSSAVVVVVVVSAVVSAESGLVVACVRRFEEPYIERWVVHEHRESREASGIGDKEDGTVSDSRQELLQAYLFSAVWRS